MRLDEDRDSLVEFLKRLGNALIRIGGLFVVGFAHWSLEKAIPFVVPENLPSAGLWLKDFSFCIFSLIYAYLLWELLVVFIPRLKAKEYLREEKVRDGNAA